jgi:hypothetical protein
MIIQIHFLAKDLPIGQIFEGSPLPGVLEEISKPLLEGRILKCLYDCS